MRGHLRQCSACEERFEQESAMLDIAANLEPLEPSEAVWQRISEKIADAEIADSERGASWRWLVARRRAIGSVGFAACAVAAVLWIRLGGQERPMESSAAGARIELATGDGVALVQPAKTVSDVTELELTEADREYQETIEELRGMLQEDRSSWSPPVAAAVDARLASFRKASQKHRVVVTEPSLIVASRDPVYATYRAEISFLQSALAGELPLVEALP